MRFNLSPTADWDSRKMSRRFQKVSGGIHSENQTPKRPFLYYTGYPPPPYGVVGYCCVGYCCVSYCCVSCGVVCRMVSRAPNPYIARNTCVCPLRAYYVCLLRARYACLLRMPIARPLRAYYVCLLRARHARLLRAHYVCPLRAYYACSLRAYYACPLRAIYSAWKTPIRVTRHADKP